MKALIVAEGGASIGLGHVRRCLSLAGALAGRGVTVVFVAWGDDGALDLIRSEGYDVHGSPNAAVPTRIVSTLRPDVIVVDSYSLESPHFERLREAAPLVVIDDLADRYLPADLVVNFTPCALDLTYRALPGTRFLLGLEYAILRQDFTGLPERRIEREVRRILLTMGGADRLEVTPRAVRKIRSVFEEAHIDVVIGPFFEAGRDFPGEGTSVHVAPKSLRDLMLAADLAVTGGGQTTFELAATGTPAVVMAVADNQVQQVAAWEALGILKYAGDARDPGTLEKMGAEIGDLVADRKARETMSGRGKKMVDGRGAERVADEMLRG